MGIKAVMITIKMPEARSNEVFKENGKN